MAVNENTFKIVRNDITKMQCDAIVNTANVHPTVGSGCDQAIYTAAGFDQLLEYRRDKIGFVEEGGAFITPAFNLNARYIIHAVSPLFIDGNWSDDSSMALAALDSINVKGKLDAVDIMENFAKWLYKGAYTPDGITFDEGNTCAKAIMSFAMHSDVSRCGITGEYANGNGALMRIMPICLYAYEQQKKDGISDKEAIEQIHQIASLTHNHLRSNIACGLYYFMIKEIIDNKAEKSIEQCLQGGLDNGFGFYGTDVSNLTEIAHYGRLFHLDKLKTVPELEIQFSGYVVHSLEAAIWCLIQTETFEAVLLKVVNYGDDSDTVGAIAGGLAGLYYGYKAIPGDWVNVIRRKDWIEQMVLLDFKTEVPVRQMICGKEEDK